MQAANLLHLSSGYTGITHTHLKAFASSYYYGYFAPNTIIYLMVLWSFLQTFEPVTIAEFMEQPVAEEVVEADTNMQGK